MTKGSARLVILHNFDARFAVGVPVESTEPTRILFRYSALPKIKAGQIRFAESWSSSEVRLA